jgi:hypothetical protein
MRVHAPNLAKPQQAPSPHASWLMHRPTDGQFVLRLADTNAKPNIVAPRPVAPMLYGYHFSGIAIHSQERRSTQINQRLEGVAKRSMDKHELPGGLAQVAGKLSGGLPEGANVENSDPNATLATSAATPALDMATKTPPKLTKKQLGWQDLGCGSFKHDIRWELDKATSKGGLVVQKVEWMYDVKSCDEKKLDMAGISWYQDYQSPYWEAWEIRKGQKVTTHAERGVPMDDQFSAPSPGEKTKGKVLVTGTPEFYDGMKLPPDFKATGKPPAGILPMTRTDPTLTGGSGTILHSFGMEWDCCQ